MSNKFDIKKALAGEPVVLRNGEKAYVRHMEQDVKTVHPLSGYTYKGAALNWNESGLYYGPTSDSVADIVGMWVEPIVFKHWNLLREDIRYLAKDANGRWFGYTRKPYVGDGGEWVVSDGKCLIADIVDRSVFPDCDWQKSLIER